MPRIQFKGKNIIVNHHLAVSHHHLGADKRKSLLAKGANPSLHDNLKALKALLPTHGGKMPMCKN